MEVKNSLSWDDFKSNITLPGYFIDALESFRGVRRWTKVQMAEFLELTSMSYYRYTEGESTPTYDGLMKIILKTGIPFQVTKEMFSDGTMQRHKIEYVPKELVIENMPSKLVARALRYNEQNGK